jgi:hypothetical protein
MKKKDPDTGWAGQKWKKSREGERKKQDRAKERREERTRKKY